MTSAATERRRRTGCMGERTSHLILEFGEKILSMPAKPARGGKWEPRFHPGVFVGVLKPSCLSKTFKNVRKVTSSHVSIWYDFLASYDEYTALVKFGNVASEHVKSAISVVQPQLSAAQQKPSAVQQNRVGALVTHHPAWMSHHTGGSRQGHPRYTGAQQWEGRGWPDQEISQSAAHRHTKCKSCLTGL